MLQLLHDYSDPARIEEILAAPFHREIPRYAANASNLYCDLRDELIARVDVESDRFYPVDESFVVTGDLDHLETRASARAANHCDRPRVARAHPRRRRMAVRGPRLRARL